MTLQERIMNKAGSKYVCLENEQSDGVDVITIANRDNDALLLNYEIGDSTISVNVVNKQKGSVVDDYDTDYTEDNFDDKIGTSISTYEAISKSYSKHLKEASKDDINDELKSKFDELMEEGSNELLDSLSDEELKLFIDYIESSDNSSIAKKFAVKWVQLLIDDRDAKKRSKSLKEDSDDSDNIIPKIEDYDIEAALESATPCQLIQSAIDKVEKCLESNEDENVKTILDDVNAELTEILDEISSYTEE